MKNQSLIIISFLVLSCTSVEKMPTDKEMLLTSTVWTTPNNDESKSVSYFYFKPDGTYMEDVSLKINNEKVTMKGKWGWESGNEIYIIYSQMNVLGKEHLISNTNEDKRIYRITEISKRKLVGIKRHIGDTEDSGFASEVTYVSAK